MFNVALALNVLFLEIYFLVFKQPGWLSLDVFIFIFCTTYILLEFPPVRRHLRPTITIHVIFGCAYAIMIIGFCIGIIAILGSDGGLMVLGAMMIGFVSIIPANILLVIGILMLLANAIRSVYRLKSDENIDE